MGTSSIAAGGTTGFPSSQYGSAVTGLTVVFSTTQWIASEGGALVAGDVLQVMNLPAGTLIFGAVLHVETADTATAATLDIGLGGADTFYDGADATTAAIPAIGTNGGVPTPTVLTSADTVDVTLKTLTGTAAAGVFRLTVFVGNGTDPDSTAASTVTPDA